MVTCYYGYTHVAMVTETPLTVAATLGKDKTREVLISLVSGGAHIDFRHMLLWLHTRCYGYRDPPDGSGYLGERQDEGGADFPGEWRGSH